MTKKELCKTSFIDWIESLMEIWRWNIQHAKTIDPPDKKKPFLTFSDPIVQKYNIFIIISWAWELMTKSGWRHKQFWGSFNMGAWSCNHSEGGHKKGPLSKRGESSTKCYPVLGGGGAICYGPAIYHFVGPALSVINDRSLTLLWQGHLMTCGEMGIWTHDMFSSSYGQNNDTYIGPKLLEF